jgi:hypothetical protein
MFIRRARRITLASGRVYTTTGVAQSSLFAFAERVRNPTVLFIGFALPAIGEVDTCAPPDPAANGSRESKV